MEDLRLTPLYDLHMELGAKMVPFAGYSMPVQYPAGVMKEHLHTRENAGVFDVSHMGQVVVSGPNWDAVALGFETLVPQDVLGLKPGRQRYGFFTNDAGGIEDDLMFARRGDDLFVVVNAACKTQDVARMKAALEPDLTVTELADRALVAVQGPKAEAVLAGVGLDASAMKFMDFVDMTAQGQQLHISRSGYTGEDGFEISVPADGADGFVRAILDQADAEPIGLGARDSLRLEAGLCLYGHDIDATTSPIEAALIWAIQKARRPGGVRAGGFPGETTVFDHLENKTIRKRIGLRPDGRAPMREGVELFADEAGEQPIGIITSGGFGPTVGAPVAMGYVNSDIGEGSVVYGSVRNKMLPATITALPFVPANFKR